MHVLIVRSTVFLASVISYLARTRAGIFREGANLSPVNSPRYLNGVFNAIADSSIAYFHRARARLESFHSGIPIW
jgi:hypothetical protein